MLHTSQMSEIIKESVSAIMTNSRNNFDAILMLSQLLMKVGQRISKIKIDLDTADYKELNKIYYLGDGSDAGLGLILNGVSLMSALPDTYLDSIEGEQNALSMSSKISQENSTASVVTKSSKARRRKN